MYHSAGILDIGICPITLFIRRNFSPRIHHHLLQLSFQCPRVCLHSQCHRISAPSNTKKTRYSKNINFSKVFSHHAKKLVNTIQLLDWDNKMYRNFYNLLGIREFFRGLCLQLVHEIMELWSAGGIKKPPVFLYSGRF